MIGSELKVSLLLLFHLAITIQLNADFIVCLSSEQVTVNTLDMQDIDDKDMMSCEKNNTSI